jgi:beta-lactamase class A
MRLRGVLFGVLGALLVSLPVRATTIRAWHFDSDRNLLKLTTDQGVQPKVQLIANPTRLVIDLPGVVLGHPRTMKTFGTLIQSIRTGQFDRDTTRIVVEVAPGYTLDPSQVKIKAMSASDWLFQLPQPQQLANQQVVLIDPQQIAVPVLSSALPLGGSSANATPRQSANPTNALALTTSMTDLDRQVRTLMRRYNFLKAGMFFVDLETGSYLDIGGDFVFPAASTIKLPILMALFQDVDAGKVRLNEILVMRSSLVAGGSGDMQDMPVGSRFSVLRTATKMITISDNTATNMIIHRLGGISRLNQRFRSWGLRDTKIRNWLADLRGTNTTSSKDMVKLLALLMKDQLLSAKSKQQTLGILRRTTTRTLLPAGLGPGASIANKTGDIGFLIGDAGVITMPNGKQYLGGIFVKRPYDDVRGRIFIQKVSRLVYNHLSQPRPVTVTDATR